MATPSTNLFENCVKWADQDAQAASLEGWGIFDLDSTGILEIQRLDDPVEGGKRFDSDFQVYQHVRDQARLGSALHMKALLVIAQAIIQEHYWGIVEGTGPRDLASDIQSCRERYDVHVGRPMIDTTLPCISAEMLFRTSCYNPEEPNGTR